MHTAKVFANGRSQAVRLPRDFRFDEDEVYITRVGDMVILYPRTSDSTGWRLLAEGVDRFTSDFMADRSQPPAADDRKRV